MENLNNIEIIEFEPTGNYEDYKKIKLRLIEKIEELRARRNYLNDYYKKELKPLLKIYAIAKRNSRTDKEIKDYIKTREEQMERDGVSEEKYLELISKCDKNIAALERLLNEYFQEEIVDGFAYPKQEALIYCKIQSIITLD